MATSILITFSVLLGLLTIKMDLCKCEIANAAAYHYSSNEDKPISANEGLLQYIGPPQVYVPICPPCQQQQQQHIPPCTQNHDQSGDLDYNHQNSDNQQQQQQHYEIDQTIDDHKKKQNVHYKFEYGVNDHKTGDVKYHKEERHGDVVRGEYALLEDDGNVRTVKYYADWRTGFHAQVINSKRRNHG